MNGFHSTAASVLHKAVQISFIPEGKLCCEGAWTLQHLDLERQIASLRMVAVRGLSFKDIC